MGEGYVGVDACVAVMLKTRMMVMLVLMHGCDNYDGVEARKIIMFTLKRGR